MADKARSNGWPFNSVGAQHLNIHPPKGYSDYLEITPSNVMEIIDPPIGWIKP